MKNTFEEPVYEEIYSLALPYLKTRGNESHTSIAFSFARRLLKREKADRRIVVPGILLHDVGWSAVPEDLQPLAFGPKMTRPDLRSLHESEGAKIARSLLAKANYPKPLSEKIAQIISRHDTLKGAGSMEEALVKDSDKLYRLSKKGFRQDVAYFDYDPALHLAFLESHVDRWFISETAKKIAKALVRARRTELARS